MQNFTYYSPTKYIFGKESHIKVGEEIKRINKNNVLIVYPEIFESNGLIASIEESLKKEELKYSLFNKVEPNPTSDLVYQGINIAKSSKTDFILAIGGGSSIDLAKSIAIGVEYDGDFWDFYCGKEIKEAIDVGVILTIASSGSESSPNAIITNKKTFEKIAIESDLIRPVFSIMNPELTLTLNKFQTASGIIDIFTHCLERYFTNTESVQLSDRLLEGIMKTLVEIGPMAIQNSEDLSSRENIMWAGTMAHNNIIGCDREQDWNSHHLEHVLSAKYNCNHGVGMAVIFPAWMQYVVSRHGLDKFVQFANRVFKVEINDENYLETANIGIEKFKKFIKKINMPINFKELGINDYDIDELVSLNNLNGKKTGGFYSLNEDDIREIYKIASINNLDNI
ncbi:iron-containing alcohol dehydrogenase [Anaerococcus porci]|uniref:iron-containing alcohol dehydrogenase n=1 Tax=Anaerococcus porci TaxID=2652269 RepID=UPI002A74E4DA|nr:iron-containing alcohol dehydrogenase [Anaerococcus porci]MDY3006536.1 iron-containing alcohol dehydrogenase [Anaerococcus porci]